MPHAYWELFFHFTWHTKDNRPLINAKVEALLHKYLNRGAVGADHRGRGWVGWCA